VADREDHPELGPDVWQCQSGASSLTDENIPPWTGTFSPGWSPTPTPEHDRPGSAARARSDAYWASRRRDAPESPASDLCLRGPGLVLNDSEEFSFRSPSPRNPQTPLKQRRTVAKADSLEVSSVSVTGFPTLETKPSRPSVSPIREEHRNNNSSLAKHLNFELSPLSATQTRASPRSERKTPTGSADVGTQTSIIFEKAAVSSSTTACGSQSISPPPACGSQSISPPPPGQVSSEHASPDSSPVAAPARTAVLPSSPPTPPVCYAFKPRSATPSPPGDECRSGVSPAPPTPQRAPPLPTLRERSESTEIHSFSPLPSDPSDTSIHLRVCTCCGGVRAFGVPARERSDHHIRSDLESSGRDEWHHYSRERRNYPRERRSEEAMADMRHRFQSVKYRYFETLQRLQFR